MFRKLDRFKATLVTAVLIALLTTVGLVISQAAGGQGGVQAAVHGNAVWFTIQNEKVSILRA